MKIALLNPICTGDISSGYLNLFQKIRGKYPPLGLAYIAACLEKENHDVGIIDAEANGYSLDEVVCEAKKIEPDLFGITGMTMVFDRSRKVAKKLKETFPETKIVVGGPQLSVFPEETLKFSEFDIGVVGEGEITFPELIGALESGKDVSKINGLAIRNSEGEPVRTPPRNYVENLDDLPMPAYHLLPMKKYQDILAKRDEYSTMITSRGCPYNCLFCDPTHRLGKKFRAMSGQKIVDEILYLHNQFGIREITFYDDTFTLNKKRITDMSLLLKKENIDLIWECRTRVDAIDRSLLKQMRDAGCYRIRYGVESGDPNILKVLRKDITLNEVDEAFKITHSLGIETMAYFILGAPTETVEILQRTIDFAIKLNPDYLNIGIMTLVSPGSDIFKLAVEEGRIDHDYWIKFINEEENDPVPYYETELLNKDVLTYYLKKAHRQFYFRPRYILRRAMNIKTLAQLRKNVLAGLAIIFSSKNA
jgi:radical SAM superfamily enzyme YgiQ (UPF0313 family)